ncbi:hypothetical protein Ciccas_004188 [Cichlidogyrus casuarinus]|uniref:F-box domain-containing protein n=1 Tax=Cichlidogyrus casuarinus TaxID=1844966 RepID=A0ABD2QD18_9PLAT
MRSPTLLDLPNEVFFRLFDYLSPLDLVRVGQTCSRLRYLSCDELIWEHRLHKSLGHIWNAVSSQGSAHVSDHVRGLDFRKLDKRSVYLTISKFVPKNQLIMSNDADIAELNQQAQISDSAEEQSSSGNSLIETIQDFFASSLTYLNPIGKLIGFVPSTNSEVVKSEARFALFGSGFDAIATNRLFNRMLDNRTKSFVPISMFPMKGNFGSGLTVRMTQQAQQAILDEAYQEFLQAENKDLVRSHKLSKIFGPGFASEEKSGPSAEPKDYYFDMVQLFATERYKNTEPRTQLERITESRLFQQPCDIHNLHMTDDLHSIVTTMNAFVYAIDARDSYDDMKLLRKELDCVNSPIENKAGWPILLLFVMPKEVIKANLQRENAIAKKNLARMNSKISELDTFSGAQLTQSWDGSLIEPVSAMRLFELENPWRLQKCASNDMRCLVQGVTWLKYQLAGKPTTCTF